MTLKTARSSRPLFFLVNYRPHDETEGFLRAGREDDGQAAGEQRQAGRNEDDGADGGRRQRAVVAPKARVHLLVVVGQAHPCRTVVSVSFNVLEQPRLGLFPFAYQPLFGMDEK